MRPVCSPQQWDRHSIYNVKGYHIYSDVASETLMNYSDVNSLFYNLKQIYVP